MRGDASSSALTPVEARTVGTGRRLLLLLYECGLVFGVLFGAGLPVVIVNGAPPDPGNPLYAAWLLTATFIYFGLSWTRGGQTLAMRTWRVRVVRVDGGALNWRNALLRFTGGLAACASGGIGFVWSAVDAEGRNWPDLMSGTQLVLMPRKH